MAHLSTYVCSLAEIPSIGDFATQVLGLRTGVLEGFTEVAGTTNSPARAFVCLVRERDGATVRSDFSDPATGRYYFEWLDTALRFTAVAYHAERKFGVTGAAAQVPKAL